MWLASEVALFSSLYFTLAMGEAICHIVSCPMERPTGKELMREYPANYQHETEALTLTASEELNPADSYINALRRESFSSQALR